MKYLNYSRGKDISQSYTQINHAFNSCLNLDIPQSYTQINHVFNSCLNLWLIFDWLMIKIYRECKIIILYLYLWSTIIIFIKKIEDKFFFFFFARHVYMIVRIFIYKKKSSIIYESMNVRLLDMCFKWFAHVLFMLLHDCFKWNGHFLFCWYRWCT